MPASEAQPLLIRLRIATLCLSLASVACVGDDPRPTDLQGVDLLRRAPDRVIEQPGLRRPSLEEGWQADREYGWVRWAEKRGGETFVWSRQREAFLTLECVSSEDRTLALKAWKPAEAPTEFPATVSLNGVEVGRFELTERPSVHVLDAPLALWRPGANRLSVAVPATVKTTGGQTVGFALAEVRYDEECRAAVEPTERTLRLVSRTAVHYVSEALVPQRLYLRGEAHGDCDLAIRVHELDARHERAQLLLEQTVRLRGDALERALDLPPDAARYEIELALQGEPKARFEFERLELREHEARERFPVVFISIDTLSARHLSVYGYERPTSPALERFAEDAIVFEHCMSNTTWTLPSYMSQMTGLYPYSHRLYPGKQAEMWELWHLSENRWTLAELLRAAGYRTAGFVDNDWITERFGLAQGFDHFDASAAALPIDDPEGGIQHVIAQAQSWLGPASPDEPAFLFLHAFDVHGPYIADNAHRGCFREHLDLSTRVPAGGDVAFGIIPTYVAETLTPEVVPQELPIEPIAAAYDEVVRMVDARLGKFFEHLREIGMYERSLILISADHGETMGDALLPFGHGVLDQDVVHVPLLVKLPNNEHGGRRVAAPVQLVDLYPTLLELLGREAHEGLHGRSLLQSLRTDPAPQRVLLTEGGAMRQAALFEGRWKLVEKTLGKDSGHPILLSALHQTRAWAEERRKEMRDPRLWRWMNDAELARAFFVERYRSGLTEELHERMRRSPEYSRLIRFLRQANDTPVIELYDLERDPLCKTNVADEHPELVAHLLGRLSAERARRDEAQKAARPPQAPPAMGELELERLRALGYLGD